MHLAEEDEFISKSAQAEIEAALASKPNATVYSYQREGSHGDASGKPFDDLVENLDQIQ